MSKENTEPTAPTQGKQTTGMQRDVPEHGWGPSVDATPTQDNPSAHRSFHPDEYAPKPGPGRTVSKEETGKVTGNTVKSDGRRGEDHAKKGGQQGHHDTGPKGASQRPSGGRDASSVTGVDPQDPAPQD
ncbi:hypothetical protein GXW83_17195 [Streptacidiphilus sp. PB12-B1b]|uniref:hypothetical protein n=1 Tax=Streptacidiphilus sp. PB12-B1b TaxID=2705012 RepID=UPI0015FD20F2|nr:hypothetical protein [Streptacidiphilus sp. PB12-B1b]QMU77183.1 hypothetical protein GXW83_17195 [Streptacidiphilus sp. PB12-B1b]